MSVPVTNGSGTSSVAAELIGTQQYQQIKVVGGETGSTSVLGVNPDRSINVSVIGRISADVAGSIAAVITGNASVSGTVGASVIGWVPIQPSNTSILTRWTDSSVIGVVTGSVVAIPTGNQSVSGTVGASLIGQLPAGTAPLGSVAALQATNPWVVVGSVYGAGSVVAFQGGTPWANTNVGSVITTQIGSVITVLQSSSIIAINAGSVIAIPSGSVITVWQSPSVVGTYAEDSPHSTGDKGIFALNVRNDTLSSVTSADGDYGALSVGPAGEGIVANSPLTKWVQGTADFRQGNTGASIVVIAAQGSSVFTYITGVQIANLGSASVLVTFAGTGSTLGYSIAPAGGGSNIYYPNALKTPANGTFAASISGIASVLVSAQGFIAKI